MVPCSRSDHSTHWSLPESSHAVSTSNGSSRSDHSTHWSLPVLPETCVQIGTAPPEVTIQHIGHFQGGRGKPRISWTFSRFLRAVGSASVPAGDRTALVGSAKSIIPTVYSSASGSGVSGSAGPLARNSMLRASSFSLMRFRSRNHGKSSQNSCLVSSYSTAAKWRR